MEQVTTIFTIFKNFIESLTGLTLIEVLLLGQTAMAIVQFKRGRKK